MTRVAHSFEDAGLLPPGLDVGWATTTLYVLLGPETWHRSAASSTRTRSPTTPGSSASSSKHSTAATPEPMGIRPGPTDGHLSSHLPNAAHGRSPETTERRRPVINFHPTRQPLT